MILAHWSEGIHAAPRNGGFSVPHPNRLTKALCILHIVLQIVQHMAEQDASRKKSTSEKSGEGRAIA